MGVFQVRAVCFLINELQPIHTRGSAYLVKVGFLDPEIFNEQLADPVRHLFMDLHLNH